MKTTASLWRLVPAALLLTACPTPYVAPSDLPSSAQTLEVEAAGNSGFSFGDVLVAGIGLGPQVSVGAGGAVGNGPVGAGLSYSSSSQHMRFRVAHRDGRHRASCTTYFSEETFFQALDCELSPVDDRALRPLVFRYFADGTGHTSGGEPIEVRAGEGHGFDLRQGDRAIGAVDTSRRPRRVYLASVEPVVEHRVVLVAACLLAMERFNGI